MSDVELLSIPIISVIVICIHWVVYHAMVWRLDNMAITASLFRERKIERRKSFLLMLFLCLTPAIPALILLIKIWEHM